MPGQISPILRWVIRLDPRSVLDVGLGFGKWGVLLRECLEVTHGRYEPSAWRSRIEGVEIFDRYKNPIWSYAYDHVHIGDVRKLAPALGQYDLVLCCDVIEHMPKEEGQELLDTLFTLAPWLLISTPLVFSQQQASENPHEQHVSLWLLPDVMDRCAAYGEVQEQWFAMLTRAMPPTPFRLRMLSRLVGWRARGLFPKLSKRGIHRLSRAYRRGPLEPVL